MAQPVNCDGACDEQALFMLHKLDDAEVAAFGPACFADFCQAYLQTVDPSRLAPPPATPRRKSGKAAAAALADDGADGKADDSPAGA